MTLCVDLVYKSCLVVMFSFWFTAQTGGEEDREGEKETEDDGISRN